MFRGKNMGNDTNVVVFITGSDEQATSIAEALLTQRKAACVNIIPGLKSLFWWQGKVDSARESLLAVKTMASLVSEIVSLVCELHQDEVPEVIALPIVSGNPSYLEWIAQETRGRQNG
jgi:periplasmic divalent cation tolerance protein